MDQLESFARNRPVSRNSDCSVDNGCGMFNQRLNYSYRVPNYQFVPENIARSS